MRGLLAPALLTLVATALLGCQGASSSAARPYDAIRARTALPSAEVAVRFFGTSTIAFDDGEDVVMIDGFFSRPSFRTVLFGRISPNQARIDHALREAGIERIAAILVAHSHYDHAMDSAHVALRTGARVFGSESTANIALGAGLPRERIHILEDGETISIGRFTVRAFETPHSPGARYTGVVAAPLRPPARVREYREGGNFSYLVERGSTRVLVVPSANFTPGKFRDVEADVVFFGIGTLGLREADFVEAYWIETVRETGARLVVPVHWDDFTRPLSEPLRPLPRPVDNFSRSMRLLTDLARRDHVTVRLPAAFEPIDLHQR